MSNWANIKAAWSLSWRSLQTQALRTYEAAIRANPSRFRPHVKRMMADLGATRARLTHLQAMLSQPGATAQDRANYEALLARYHELAAGIYADSRPVQQARMAGPPVVAIGVVIGG